jgi:uncharacterized membrane protein YccC
VDTLTSLQAELHDIAFTGPRARIATAAALSTGLAALLALWLRADYVWWAAISGFACSQTTRPASVSRAAQRIMGSVIGAAIGLLAVAWLIDDRLLCLLFLLLSGVIGVFGLNCGTRSYAWLLGSITASMVVTSSMADPTVAVTVAVSRGAEVVIGSLAALLVAVMLSVPDTASAHAPPPHSWSSAITPGSPVMAHATRTGLAVMLVPLVWNWLELPGVSQMAVSIAAVMAVPAAGGSAAVDRHVVLRRGVHRVLGCLLGGVAGLALLALSVEMLTVWMTLLMAGVWLCAHVNQSRRGVDYVGLQANVALIVTMMQGWTPPLSPLPAIDRLTGMLGGLGLLLIVLMVTWPHAVPATEDPHHRGGGPVS